MRYPYRGPTKGLVLCSPRIGDQPFDYFTQSKQSASLVTKTAKLTCDSCHFLFFSFSPVRIHQNPNLSAFYQILLIRVEYTLKPSLSTFYYMVSIWSDRRIHTKPDLSNLLYPFRKQLLLYTYN